MAASGDKNIRFIAVLRISFEVVEPPERMRRGGALHAPLARDKHAGARSGRQSVSQADKPGGARIGGDTATRAPSRG
jgi:hypothetical protein